MAGWEYWMGKKVFIILKNKRTYQGEVIEVETSTSSPLIWIIITDKFERRVTFSVEEIDVIQEEERK